MIKTTKEQVAQELKEVANKIGYINETIINEHCKFSRRAIRTHFGSISKACEELNIKQDSKKAPSRKGMARKIWSKEEVITLINELVQKYTYFSKGLINLGGPEYGLINHKVITRIWGSFENMYNELNIPQKPSPKGIKIISDEVYEDIIKTHISTHDIKEFNSVILSNICKIHFINYATVCERFGPSIQEVANHFNIPYIVKWQSEENALSFVAYFLHDFTYIKQYRNNDIKHIRTLPVDGFWPDYNLCVEYNGRQHYKFSKHFHKTEKDFDKRQYLDVLKYKQIKDLGFKLLIIKYNDSEQDVLNKLNILFPNQTSN